MEISNKVVLGIAVVIIAAFTVAIVILAIGGGDEPIAPESPPVQSEPEEAPDSQEQQAQAEQGGQAEADNTPGTPVQPTPPARQEQEEQEEPEPQTEPEQQQAIELETEREAELGDAQIAMSEFEWLIHDCNDKIVVAGSYMRTINKRGVENLTNESAQKLDAYNTAAVECVGDLNEAWDTLISEHPILLREESFLPIRQSWSEIIPQMDEFVTVWFEVRGDLVELGYLE